MSYNFGSQKNDPIFGTYGEFTVGTEDNRIRAQFLLTKMKPGTEGSWENLLASQMVPWREVFKVEELTFDELLQRDLDDSRVAHDLIPYLLGEKEASARFFPPVLAVLVPKNTNQAGIQSYYPTPTNQNDISISFGDIFDFEKVKFENNITPLGVIKYNRQKAGFVIVDGQHRAMAVLALHRQINSSWGADRYASYYDHLNLSQDKIKSIELPVCIIFFPDLFENNVVYKDKGIDLKRVCREIFLVVNKTAKRVSQSRELLLDDEDLAARMMRSTLSKLKGRSEEESSLARIYSFAYGDSDTDLGKQVVAGQLEYSSAVALYKMHAAISFGVQDAFNFYQPSDITDLRRAKNTARPIQILLGSELQKWSTLSRFSGKSHPPNDIELAIQLLGNITDIVMIELVDKFRPFVIHNMVMWSLSKRLSEANARADLIQSKCYSLLFEGSGVRSVFDDHLNRLRERKEELVAEDKPIGDYMTHQIEYAIAVTSALSKHEKDIKNQRSAKFFSIDYDKFFNSDNNETDRILLLSRAKTIFDTISTQAFQLGFLMAIHSVVESILDPSDKYDKRVKLVSFITKLYIDALNMYFSPEDSVEHRSLVGYVNDSKANVFDSNQLGLRGLLAQTQRVNELNERQWIFFRYSIIEIVHSKHAYQSLLDKFNSLEDISLVETYKNYLPKLIKALMDLRNDYISSSIQTAFNQPEFKQEIDLLKAKSFGEGKSEDEVEKIVKEKTIIKEIEIREKCMQHLLASLGEMADEKTILSRLGISS